MPRRRMPIRPRPHEKSTGAHKKSTEAHGKAAKK